MLENRSSQQCESRGCSTGAMVDAMYFQEEVSYISGTDYDFSHHVHGGDGL